MSGQFHNVIKEDFLTKLFVTLMLIVFIIAVIRISAADGTVDFCYIETSAVSGEQFYNLYGHRPWRPDRTIAIRVRLEEVRQITSVYGCDLK